MMLAPIIGGGMLIFAAGYVAFAIWRAPVGYEDERGWHAGDPDTGLDSYVPPLAAGLFGERAGEPAAGVVAPFHDGLANREGQRNNG